MLQIALINQPIVDASESVLKFWHGVVHSWGVAIILLTFTIRLLILPLTVHSLKSMQKLQVLQPEIKKIQARYKDDSQRKNQETMKFYQENKVNPLGSCLPLLLQLPFFISLFYLLRSNGFKADIEGAEKFLFIPNLAKPLTGHPVILGVMIVLYVGTQLAASLVTTVGGDKNQQRIMFALPFVFTIFIVRFQAGLIVYWITTNVWTLGQQLVVRKIYPRPVLLGADGGDGGDRGSQASTPARGKPAPEVAAAVTDGKGSGGKGSDGKGSVDGSNGAPAKAPPGAPRKKKKRSGRRR